MIEAQTLAGPIAVLRAIANPPRPAPLQEARERAMNPPDPNAPAGPRPSFRSTPLEQMRQMRLIEPVQKAAEAEVDTAYARGKTVRTVTELALNQTL